MSSRLTWSVLFLTLVASVILVARSLASDGVRRAPIYPGNAALGEGVFVAHCGKCHTMRAAGSRGTMGPDLDNLPNLTFAVVINAVVEGAGGIQAEYAIHGECTTGSHGKCLTYNQLNDVAKFVTTEDGKPGFSMPVPQPVPT
jgi:mono/diheme cytochrome c family protein